MRSNLSRYLIALAITAFIMVMADQLLTLPGGFGIQPYQGWQNQCLINSANAFWFKHHLFWGQALPLSLMDIGRWQFVMDSALFEPIYACAALATAIRLHRLHRQDQHPGLALLSFWFVVTPLALLVPIDWLENSGGMDRLGAPWPWSVVSTVIGLALLLTVMRITITRRWMCALLSVTKCQLASNHGKWGAVAVLLVAIAPPVLAIVSADTCHVSWTDKLLWFYGLTACAHAAKAALALTLLLTIAGSGIIWFFGFHLNAPALAPVAGRRMALRRGVFDVVGRTRYILLIIVAFLGLILGLSQCQDLLLGMASAISINTWKGALASLVAAAISLWMLSFSCWMWARQLCRLSIHGSPTSTPGIERFAQLWARVLGLLPLGGVAVLAAWSTRDAISAASTGQLEPNQTALYVLIFGLVSVVIGVLFLWTRVQRHRTQAGLAAYFYYNGGPGQQPRPSFHGDAPRLFFVLPDTPIWLPLIALLAMLVLRTYATNCPDNEAMAPVTMAIVTFALTWWLGLLSWITVTELRTARLWLLVPILLIGLLSALGWTDNHAVPFFRGATTPPPKMLWTWLTAIVAAALYGAWIWIELGKPAFFLPGNCLRKMPRLATLLLALVAWWGIDLSADRDHAYSAPQEALDTRPSLQQALEQWLNQLPKLSAGSAQTPYQVYLIASEGGGARSAYWTAQVLKELHRTIEHFDRRTFALSGVSGGSVGEAVYMACLKKSEQVDLSKCIEQYGRGNPLTPLLGAWLFEDLFARLLPTSIHGINWLSCQQAGCGFLSRGLWFEAELKRVVPDLHETLYSYIPTATNWRPALFLNSTWVETGERTIASTVKILPDDFPTARDEVDELFPRQITLASAAHNSARFPFINSIGAMRCAKPGTTVHTHQFCSSPGQADVNSEHVMGHLADGGYFDNSGAHTLIDIAQAMSTCLQDDARHWKCGHKAGGTNSGTSIAATHNEQSQESNLRPIIILIRNGQITKTMELDCAIQKRNGEPKPQCMNQPPEKNPTSGADELQQTSAANSLGLYADLLGPPIALLNVSGLHGNGRRAPGMLPSVARGLQNHLNPATSIANGSTNDTGIYSIDQIEDGMVYPLGWYLSGLSRQALAAQAQNVAAALPR